MKALPKIDEQLTPNPIQITVASGRKSDGNLVDEETFNSIIWTLDVTNKHPKIHFSRTASNCFAFIHVKHAATEIPLKWTQYIQEPIECITHTPIPENGSPRDEYHKIFGYHYVQNIVEPCSVPDIFVQVGETYELYFLFTFEASNFAYFIVSPRIGTF